MANLMIVESPNKIEKLKSILGNEWTIKASYGHIQDLPKNGELGINKKTLELKYELSKKGRKVVSDIKRDLNSYDRVVIATDPDREGEAIAEHLRDRLNLGNNYERATFNSITKDAVLRAVEKEVRKIDSDLVNAQEARRMIDRVAGWDFTAALTAFLGQLSPVGRVQSQAINMIVQRDYEIEKFQETEHWGIRSYIGETDKETWTADLNVKQSGLGKVVDGGSTCWTDKNAAEALKEKLSELTVVESEKSKTKESAPMPFETSTLQQSALNQLGFNSKKTDSIAQQLYTLGHITYIRTDSTEISDEGFESLSQYADDKGLPVLTKKRVGQKGAVDQEAHECIRPTDFYFDGDGLSADEKAMYKMIWTRTMASQLEPATRMKTTTKMVAEIDGQKYIFNATGSVPVDKGWRVILDEDHSEDIDERDSNKKNQEKEAKNPVPVLEKGQVVKINKSELTKSKTKKPTPYTQASLTKKLKQYGIGRPSTYTSIYEKIGDSGHKYIYEDNSKSKKTPFLRPNERAFDLVEAVGDIFKIMDIDFTKKMEDGLDDIANGKLDNEKFLKEFFELVDEEIALLKEKQSKNPRNPCEKCGSNMIRMPNKERNGFWWRCSSKECSNTAQDLNGKPATEEDLKKIHQEKIAPFLNEDNTPKFPCPTEGCGKALVRIPSKKKEGVYFWACSSPRDSGCNYTAFDDAENKEPVHDVEAFFQEKREQEKRKFSNEDGSPLFPCPKCGEHLVKRKGKKSMYWACSQKNDVCDFSTWCDSDGDPVMNPDEVKAEREAKKAEKLKKLSNPDGTPKWPCGSCGGHLDKRQSKKDPNKHWFGCMNFPNCKQTYFEDDEGNPKYDDSNGGAGKRKKRAKRPVPKIMKAAGK